MFKAGEDGELVGEVAHEPTVAELLLGGMFFPADPADYDTALKLSTPPIEGAPAAGALTGSPNFEAVQDIGDKQYQLSEIVAAAHSASGMSVDEWNALTETERDDLIEAELDRMEGALDEKPAGGLPLESNTPPAAAPEKAASKKKVAK